MRIKKIVEILNLTLLSIILCLIVLSGCKKSTTGTGLVSTKDSNSTNTADTSSDNANNSNGSLRNVNNSSNNNTTATQYSFPLVADIATATIPETFFDSTNSSDPSGSTDFPFSTNVRNVFFKGLDSGSIYSSINLLYYLRVADHFISKLNDTPSAAAACLQEDGIEYSVNLPKLGTAAYPYHNGTGVRRAADWNAPGSTTTMSLPHYKLFAGCRSIMISPIGNFSSAKKEITDVIQLGKGTPGLKEINFFHWENLFFTVILMVSASDEDASKIVIDGIIATHMQTYNPYYTSARLVWDYSASGSTAGNDLSLNGTYLGETDGVFDGSLASGVVQFRVDENAGLFQMTAAGLNTGVCGVQLVANRSSYFVQGSVESLARVPTESNGIYTLTSNCSIDKPSFAGSGSALDTASINGLGSSDYTLYNATVGGFARAPNDTFQLDGTNGTKILSYSASNANTFGAGTGPNLSIATDGQNTIADVATLMGYANAYYSPRQYGIAYLLGIGIPHIIKTPRADLTDVSDVITY